MRTFADTLPTLRDDTAAVSTQEEPRLFKPASLVRAIKADSGRRPEPEARTDTTGAGPSQPGAPAPPGPVTAASKHSAALRSTLERIRNPRPQAQGPTAEDAAPRAPSASRPHASMPRPNAPAPPGRAAPRIKAAIPPLETPAEEIKDPVAIALAQARREADAERESAVKAARAEEQARARAELETARRTWCAEETARFQKAFDEAMAALAARLDDAVGRTLAPLVEAEIRREAVGSFAATLNSLLDDSAEPFLTIAGPPDLIDRLSTTLADRSGLTFQPADAPELSVTIGDTRLSTTLGAWSSRLAKAMEGER